MSIIPIIPVHPYTSTVQYSLFLALSLRSIGMDFVISELCYKGTILQRIYRKMTILWPFSYHSFVKFPSNYPVNYMVNNMTVLYIKSC